MVPLPGCPGPSAMPHPQCDQCCAYESHFLCTMQLGSHLQIGLSNLVQSLVQPTAVRCGTGSSTDVRFMNSNTHTPQLLAYHHPHHHPCHLCTGRQAGMSQSDELQLSRRQLHHRRPPVPPHTQQPIQLDLRPAQPSEQPCTARRWIAAKVPLSVSSGRTLQWP